MGSKGLLPGQRLVNWPPMSIAEHKGLDFEEDEIRESVVSGHEVNQDLIERYLNGEAEALCILFEKYSSHLMRCMMHYGLSFHEAADMRQDVFIVVMQKIGQLREPKAFAGWLRQIARTRIINRGARIQQPQSMDMTDEKNSFAFVDRNVPEHGAIESERQKILRKAMKTLSDMDRRSLRQFYFQHLALKDIADAEDAPLGTIKRRLHNARKRLKKAIQEMTSDESF